MKRIYKMAPLDSPIQTEARTGRFDGIVRDYSPADVERLRGSVRIEHTLARLGAERLWELLDKRDFVNALGATNGTQAMQQVRAGLEAIYLSGWQVAAEPTPPARCTRTRACTRRIRCRKR
jgi:isocitrate lyase